jgi:mannose-6-phosphate isomerase-like protein (cupin superfamily)
MKFSDIQTKGQTKCLIAESVDPQKLRIHISEVAAGTRAHPPHTHAGVEAFYMLEGTATVEVEGEHFALGPNEAITIDASRPHGIFNSSSARIRYLVIIAQ